MLAMPTAATPAHTYSSVEACAAAGITFRQLDYWDRTRLVVPTLPARGSGSHRRYSYGDVLALAVIAELLRAGLSLQAVRKIADRFIGLTSDDVDGRSLVLTGDGDVKLADGPEILDLLAEPGVMHLFPLGGLVDDVDARLDRFDAARHERHGRHL